MWGQPLQRPNIHEPQSDEMTTDNLVRLDHSITQSQLDQGGFVTVMLCDRGADQQWNLVSRLLPAMRCNTSSGASSRPSFRSSLRTMVMRGGRSRVLRS